MGEVEVMNHQWVFSNPPGCGPAPGLPNITMASTTPRSRTSLSNNSSSTTANSLSVVGSGCDIMSQIHEINEGLYLCGARAVKINKLRELGITCIFNVTIELPNLLIDQVEYVKINIEDSPYANLAYYFDKVADKIEEVRRRGGKSLIHCVAGVSRSASLCIAYLIKHKRMSLRKAYQHVKARRSIVRPNVGFFRQLIEYETRFLGTASVTMVWNVAAGGHIPDLYEPEYSNTLCFLKKYGTHNQSERVGPTNRCSTDTNIHHR